jgi:hypothetical protein
MAERVRDEVCRLYDPDRAGHPNVYTDQYEGHSFTELARSAGLNLIVTPWTGGAGENSKLARFKAVRLAMLNGSLKIPNDPDLIRELRSVRGFIAPSGAERIELPRDSRGHCDRVAAVVLGASVALEQGMSSASAPQLEPGSPEYYKKQSDAEREAAFASNRKRIGKTTRSLSERELIKKIASM